MDYHEIWNNLYEDFEERGPVGVDKDSDYSTKIQELVATMISQDGVRLDGIVPLVRNILRRQSLLGLPNTKTEGFCDFVYNRVIPPVIRQRAEGWLRRAQEQTDTFARFSFLFFAFESLSELIYGDSHGFKEEKKYEADDHKIMSKVKQYLSDSNLVQELQQKPLQNMNPGGDQRWDGSIKSSSDIDGVVEFLFRARNNLFHGDKDSLSDRDVLVITNGVRLLELIVPFLLEQEGFAEYTYRSGIEL